MNTIISNKLLIAPLIPIAAALLIMASAKRPNLREGFSVIGALLTFAAIVYFLPRIMAGGVYEWTPLILYPGVTVKFRLDALGALFALTSSFLWIMAAFYCIGYMRALKEHAQTRFYFCYAVAVGAGIGVAFSGSLFTLYLFYEVISVITYPLVMHHQDEEGYLGGRKYIIYLMFTSKAFLLAAMALTYVICGTLDFSTAGVTNGIFPAGGDRTMITVTYLLFLFGFAKSGIMPLHNWLPDAMVAPTPVSALLHAVVVVKAGVFSICRVMLSLFGVNLLQSTGLGLFTAYFVSFTIIVASVIAMTKTNLKARLAYSTVSQLSYIILGVAMLTPRAITGGLIHIANHGVSKITLFFCAGAIAAASGKKDIRELGGIGWRMPFTMVAFGLASLSMVGAPPVSGFVSKWYLALGSMDIHNGILLGVLLASSLLNACYFMPIVLTSFFGSPPAGETGRGSIEGMRWVPFMVAPLFVTALVSVAMGIYPDFLVSITKLVGGG
jgi:multicomponent Na+:H+ antiporter subunit D